MTQPTNAEQIILVTGVMGNQGGAIAPGGTATDMAKENAKH